MNDWKNCKFSGIYLIVNAKNGMIYIGQAQNIAKRVGVHANSTYDNCTYLQRAVKKYGWSVFNVFILEEVENINLLNEREQYWIDKFDSANPKTGYNICKIAGSCRGRKQSPETLAKLSKIRTGRKASEETKKRMSEALLNMPKETRDRVNASHKSPSPETRAKISAALKGKPNTSNIGKVNSPETRAKISAALKEYYRINGAKPLSEEAKERLRTANLGKKMSAEQKQKISKALKGRAITEWHKDRIRKANTGKINKSRIKILQINKYTKEIIKEWDSIKLAGETLNINRGSISNCCSGKTSTAGGYAWRYAL